MRRTTMAAAALVALPLTTGGSSVAAPTATMLGEIVANPNVSCLGGGTVIQGGVAPGGPSYTTPTRGVITSFSTQVAATDGETVRLGLFGPPSAGSFPVLAKSRAFATVVSSVNTFDVRIPVQSGWLLGAVFTSSASPRCGQIPAVDNAADDLFAAGPSDLSDPAVAAGTEGNYHVNISTVFEPDVDGDGYGDVSQDACPESALAVAPCPAPDTTITHAKAKKAGVMVAFSSTIARSTFLVSVDGKPAKEYLSPYRAKLKPGKHTFSVRAVSPLGITDPTAATTKVKVKKAKRHR